MRTIRDRAQLKILISLPIKNCLSKPNLTKLALNKDQVQWRKMKNVTNSGFSWKIEIKRLNLGKYVTLDQMWDSWCRYFKIYLFFPGLLSPVVSFVMCKEPKKRKLNKILKLVFDCIISVNENTTEQVVNTLHQCKTCINRKIERHNLKYYKKTQFID